MRATAVYTSWYGMLQTQTQQLPIPARWWYAVKIEDERNASAALPSSELLHLHARSTLSRSAAA